MQKIKLYYNKYLSLPRYLSYLAIAPAKQIPRQDYKLGKHYIAREYFRRKNQVSYTL